MSNELPSSPPRDDEQISAAVEAEIEHNSSRILRDYPLPSLTPIIEGAASLQLVRALPVRSWPINATPNALPTFKSDNEEGFALLDRPLDGLSLQERAFVDQNMYAAGRLMHTVLSQQPVENMHFRDIPREVIAAQAPDATSYPTITALDTLMHSINIPRPSPASGSSVVGVPPSAPPSTLLQSYMESSTSLPPPASPSKAGPSTPKKRSRDSPLTPNGSPNFYVEVPVSPSRHLKKSSLSQVDLVAVQKTVSQRAADAAGTSGPPATPTKINGHTTSDKNAVDKLASFLEDIFEAEDSHPMEMPHAALGTSIFLYSSSSDSIPLLSPLAIRHTLKLVRSVVKASKVLDVPFDDLARLLKILERSVKLAEDLEVVPPHLRTRRSGLVESPTTTTNKGKGGKKSAKTTPAKRRNAPLAKVKTSPIIDEEEEDQLSGEEDDGGDFQPGSATSQRGKKGRSHSTSSSRSKSPQVNGHAVKEEVGEKNEVWAEDELQKMGDDLRKVDEAVLASELSLAVLTGATLPKQLYSEELIGAVFTVVKAQLDTLVFPAIEAAADCEEGRASGLAHPLSISSIRILLDDIFRIVSAVLPLAGELVRMEDLPESIVIPAVIIAISPFFVDTPAPPASRKGKGKETLGIATLKVVQISALTLLRMIFAKYPDQRAWIIEEIVNSLTKLTEVKKAKRQFRLRTGQTIHNVSALLMHLVQSTAYGVQEVVTRQTARDAGEEDSQGRHTTSASQVLNIARPSVKASLESAMMAANTVVKLLLERSKSSTKSSSEADYRAVFDNLVTDLLAVFDLPEWPVASFMLHVCLRRMFAALDLRQQSAEITALRSLSLDHLGAIGAKLCERSIRVNEGDSIVPLQQTLKSGDDAQLALVIESQQVLIGKLNQWKTEDASSESAAAFVAIRWASDLIRAVDRLSFIADDTESQPDLSIIDPNRAALLLPQLQKALCDLFAARAVDQYMAPDIDEIEADLPRINELAVRVAWAQNQAEILESLLIRVLDVLQTSEAAGQRSKALRALGKIVEQDANIFARDDVRYAIEQRFRDTQPSVRDAAFDLLGTYVVHDARLAVRYLPRIGDRITDTGLSVRKRVIKLLRSIYSVIEDDQQKTEICRRLLSRVKDDDDGIKDLAVTAVEDIWFARNLPTTPRKARARSDVEIDVDVKPELAKYAVLGRSQIFMNLAASMRERGSPLEEMLKLILNKHAEAPNALTLLRTQMRELVDGLVEALIEPSSSTFNPVSCVKALDILVAVDPSILSIDKAEALQPYLQVSASAHNDLHLVREHLLRVFRVCVPLMGSSALNFATKLEAILFDMLKRPPIQPQAMVELVSCVCSIVKSHTHDWSKLCSAFKRFYDAAKATANKLRVDGATNGSKPVMTVTLLARLVALLCEYSDFDAIRLLSPEAETVVDAVTPDSVHAAVFDWLLSIYSDSALILLRSVIMTSLGFLFRGFPTLMLDPAATTIMDEVFASTDIDEQARLLGVVQDFLTQQAERNAHVVQKATKPSSKATKDKVEVDMHELIGNTDNFADSGVSSAIVQRYLAHILQAAQSTESRLRAPAVDIIGFTIRQGLAHPLECLPTVVALETSPDIAVAKRMLALHTTLHTKHAELIHSRFFECAKASWQYLARLLPRGRLRGYRSTTPATALFDGWYSMLREKRKWKLDYLKGLLRAFHVDPAAGSCTQADVDVARYVGENLGALDYKTMEEVFAVIAGLDRLLVDLGPQTCHLLEERLDGEANAMEVDELESQVAVPRKQLIETTTFAALIRASQVLGVALVLRDHLKSLYKVTDAKLSKYTPNRKSAAGDKAAIRGEGSTALAFEQLPLLDKTLDTEAEQRDQANAWIETVGSDSLAAPEADE